MGPNEKILDDIARVAGGAVNILSGLQIQMREDIRSRIEDAAARLDLVPRPDFERAEAMIKKLGARCDALEKRIEALESGKKKNTKNNPAPRKTARKAAAKKKNRRKTA